MAQIHIRCHTCPLERYIWHPAGHDDAGHDKVPHTHVIVVTCRAGWCSCAVMRYTRIYLSIWPVRAISMRHAFKPMYHIRTWGKIWSVARRPKFPVCNARKLLCMPKRCAQSYYMAVDMHIWCTATRCTTPLWWEVVSAKVVHLHDRAACTHIRTVRLQISVLHTHLDMSSSYKIIFKI